MALQPIPVILILEKLLKLLSTKLAILDTDPAQGGIILATSFTTVACN